LDTKGAARIKRIYPDDTVTIFILPPKMEALRQRIRLRSKGAKEENLATRLGLARKELVAAGRYDYRIVNDDFNSAANELKNIVIKKIIS
jgi:guanylate kinase